jgi:hypothetical protein
MVWSEADGSAIGSVEYPLGGNRALSHEQSTPPGEDLCWRILQ